MKPVIFISAVSKELAPSRQLVANTLIHLGYQPDWQDIFGTEAGDLKKVLRNKINRAHGVIQIVGKAYGHELKAPDPHFPQASYTQYEAHYARGRNRPVWYLMIEDDFPAICFPPEPENLTRLQLEYRNLIASYGVIRHKASNQKDLENIVLKLRDELARLRTKMLFWGVANTLVLLSIIVILAILLGQSNRIESIAQRTEERIDARLNDLDKKLIDNMLELLRTGKLKGTEAEEFLSDAFASNSRLLESAYPLLEKAHDLPTGSLSHRLPQYLAKYVESPDVDALVRAQLFYILGSYEKAEYFALEARKQALAHPNKSVDPIVEALRTAGRAARQIAVQSHDNDSPAIFARARKYFESADQFTSPERNYDQWVLVKAGLAQVWAMQSLKRQAVEVLEAISQQKPVRSWDAYSSVIDVSKMLNQRSFHPEATRVLELATPLLPDVKTHPLAPVQHQYNVAWNLHLQGMNLQAGELLPPILAEARALSDPAAKPLAAKIARLHARILMRSNNLTDAEPAARLAIQLQEEANPSIGMPIFTSQDHAEILRKLGRIKEADAAFDPVWKRRRELVAAAIQMHGPEDDQAFFEKVNLAEALEGQAKHADALSVWQDIWHGRRQHLGEKNVTTLWTLEKLGSCYSTLDNHAEAENHLRQLFQLRQSSLGMADPATMGAYRKLGLALHFQKKYAECSELNWQVINNIRTTLPPDHPDVMSTTLSLGIALGNQGENTQAVDLLKASLGASKAIEKAPSQVQLSMSHQIGVSLKALNKPSDSAVYFESAWRGRKTLLGESHDQTTASLEQLADCQSDLKQYAPAEKNYRELHRLSIISRGAEDSHTLWLAGCLGGMLCSLERYTESEEILSKNYQSQAKVLGSLHASTLWSRDAWIYVLRQQNKDKEADKLERTLPDKETSAGQ